MHRSIVEVLKIRMIDVTTADVINRDVGARDGWFVVDDIRRLPSQELRISDASRRSNVMGLDNDLVGLQITKLVEIADEPDEPDDTDVSQT